jgi:hypothetical protein
MYAIYTGLLGGVFAAAAATIPYLAVSIGLTIWHLFSPKEKSDSDVHVHGPSEV